MKVAILTTETTHHSFFVRELREAVGPVGVFVETREARVPFDTRHSFEEVREEYERAKWFGGKKPVLSDYAPLSCFHSLNEQAAVAAIRREAPDLVVVFGTSRLEQAMIESCPPTILNLHGGDPESYRGLDSHLWAIYHRDFKGIVTTMHRVSAQLDTGEIVSQAKVPIRKGMPLSALRAANTEICVQLTVAAVDVFRRLGKVMSRPQRKVGRYYSSMPAELKDICEQNFAEFTARLTAHET